MMISDEEGNKVDDETVKVLQEKVLHAAKS